MMLTARVVRNAPRTRFIDRRPFVPSHRMTARFKTTCCVTCLWRRQVEAATRELNPDPSPWTPAGS
ncbi:MAG: hypothetical protein P8125_04405 [Gemmatimonadota bacterium]